VGGALGLVAVGPRRAARVLGEWLPTSGGTGGYDPFARGGVNDGDDEVKGENAKSTGMTQTDTFLDSPLPSLYDMINDQYGEPFKPKDQEHAIALGPQEKVNESNKPPADNLRPNREFPTTRKSPRRPREASDRAARALFEVRGRTPLHVRAAAFDTFDGRSWHEAPVTPRTYLFEKEPDSCWMKVVESPPTAVFAEAEAHQFKVTSPPSSWSPVRAPGGSAGRWLPAPPHLTRFRVGRVDRADFFGWGQDRILRLAQRKTPSGIVVETECRTVDPRLLHGVEFPSRFQGERVRHTHVPSTLDPAVAALARRWAAGHPQGWPQVAAVVEQLRTKYILDPTARVPDDCRDPLGHFLLRSRRGPDYQFATAAAVLLRVLGYPTRLVSGFYVSPETYDHHTRHTPVVAEDLHFWVELLLPCADWLVVEPTPGYEVLGPSPSLSQRLLAALFAVVSWLGRHALALAAGVVGAGALWRRRRETLDLLAVTFWRCFPGRTWQQCVRRALRLLERRGRWAGRARRPSETVQTWLGAILVESSWSPVRAPGGSAGPASEGQELGRLTSMAEWAAYAPGLPPPWEEAEARAVCRRVLDAWTLRRWRRAAGALNGA
jgi:transglutaminase-like putative cysteine protease